MIKLLHLQGIWRGERYIWTTLFRFCCYCHYFTMHFIRTQSIHLSPPHLKGRFSVVLVKLSPGIQRRIKLMEMILFSLAVIVLIWWFSLVSFHPELICKAIVVPGTMVTTVRDLRLSFTALWNWNKERKYLFSSSEMTSEL